MFWIYSIWKSKPQSMHTAPTSTAVSHSTGGRETSHFVFSIPSCPSSSLFLHILPHHWKDLVGWVCVCVRWMIHMGSSSLGRGKNSYDCSFKILLIGDSGVGKSSLLLSFISGSVHDLSPTIGTTPLSSLSLSLFVSGFSISASWLMPAVLIIQPRFYVQKLSLCFYLLFMF